MVVATLAPYDAAAWLFGSSARGDVNALSDIDVAVEAHQALPTGLLSELRERIEESTVPFHVEVVDLSSASAELRERVKREGILWTAP